MNDTLDLRRAPEASVPATDDAKDESDVVTQAAAEVAALPSRPSARLALDIRDPSSSGVIDVHALCPAGATLGPAPSRLAERPRPAAPPDPERRLLWTLTGLSGAAIAALFAAVLTAPQPTIVVRAAPPPAPSLDPMHLHTAERPPVATPEPIDLDDPDALQQPAAAGDDDPTSSPEPAADALAPEPEAKAKSTRKAKRPSTPAKASSPSKPAASPTSSAPKPSSEISVECVLDPASCGRGGSTGGSSGGKATGNAGSNAGLPDKLTASTLRTHLSSAKSKAKTCAPRHGASSGDKVQVKLSIEGATGRVISAAALGDAAGSGLGDCVADALADASFPRFSAPQQGVVYTVTM